MTHSTFALISKAFLMLSTWSNGCPLLLLMCEEYSPHRVDPLVDEQEPLSLYCDPFLIYDWLYTNVTYNNLVLHHLYIALGVYSRPQGATLQDRCGMNSCNAHECCVRSFSGRGRSYWRGYIKHLVMQSEEFVKTMLGTMAVALTNVE